MVCSKCGKELKDHWKMCPFCSTLIEKEEINVDNEEKIETNSESKSSDLFRDFAKEEKDRELNVSESKKPKDNLQYAKECMNNKNYKEAYKLFVKYGNLNDSDIEYSIGVCLEHMNDDLYIKDKNDLVEAKKYYESAAKKGHKFAINALVRLYSFHFSEEGEQREYWTKKKLEEEETVSSLVMYADNDTLDDGTRLKYYVKAAKMGDLHAQVMAAHFYRLRGNYKEALKWYEIAVEQGDLNAMHWLGTMYEEGLGVKMNCRKAVELYRKVIKEDKSKWQIAAKAAKEKLKKFNDSYY